MAHSTTRRTSQQEQMQHGKDAGAQAMDKAKDVGTQTLDKAKEAVDCVSEMAGQAVSTAGKKADDMTTTAGQGLRAAGDAIEKQGPHGGMSGYASHAVANTLQEGGKYLEQAKLSGMAQDFGNLVKNHPMPALLICLGIGFCVGRAMKD